MQRRLAPLLLAALVALPFALPTSAAQPPTAPAETGPGAPPAASPVPGEPTAQPSPAPTPEPTIEPSREPVPDGTPGPPSGPPTPGTDPGRPAPGRSVPGDPTHGRPDPTGRYIVMLRDGADAKGLLRSARREDGLEVDRRFSRAFDGFAAHLDARQKRALEADPDVLAVVPDGIVELAQTVPTGVARVGGRLSPIADIDGSDERVDADVAIVDTGIAYHPDLNVAGGYNCSTSDRTLWRDKNNHGTHVAGTVAALDNGFGVVGVAPGARVWAVKILNDDGYGLISWYVCGLDWILAQRDPSDSSRPLFEAVNMSVTKAGSDDHNCGFTEKDVLHQAICRVVAGGITVVAAAANDSHSASRNIPASYNEVITVSALADTDGKPGGLGGPACYSWGGYDKDDTFANFSNYGGDVDIMAPGKCILSTVPGSSYATLSGTSMAAPTVAGAVALYKASRPKATPAEVRESLRYLGNLNWKLSTDPDPYHEPLLDVARIGNLGTFGLSPGAATPAVEAASTVDLPLTVARSSTFFERVRLSLTSVPSGWTARLADTSLMGWTATSTTVTVTVPFGTPNGTYDIGVRGTNQGRTVTSTLHVQVVADAPTASAPVSSLKSEVQAGTSSVRVRVKWPAATDPTSPIAGYEVQASRKGGAWGSTRSRPASKRGATYTIDFDTSYRFRVRAVDRAGHWSPWAVAGWSTHAARVDDRSSSVVRSGTWLSRSAASAYRQTLLGSRQAGATASLTFSGHGLAVLAPKGPKRGKVEVLVDGTSVGILKLRSSTATSRWIAVSRAFTTAGTHTVRLRAIGTGRYPEFRLDAFVILR